MDLDKLTPEAVEKAKKVVAEAQRIKAEKEAMWRELPYAVKVHLCETELGGHQWDTLHSDDAYPLPYGEICRRCNMSWRGMGPKDRPNAQ